MAGNDAKPKVVCLCGSTRFKNAFLEVQENETLRGHIVLSVGLFGHHTGLDMEGDTKKMLDELHLRKIDLADEVIFLNVGGYVGSSTFNELKYSIDQSKRLRFREPVSSGFHPEVWEQIERYAKKRGRRCLMCDDKVNDADEYRIFGGFCGDCSDFISDIEEGGY